MQWILIEKTYENNFERMLVPTGFHKKETNYPRTIMKVFYFMLKHIIM